MQYQISIIIPVLNEEIYIRKLLEHLPAVGSTKNILEIIVVDGGSTDGTQDIVKTMSSQAGSGWSGRASRQARYKPKSRPLKYPETKSELEPEIKLILLEAPKGRAKQMNLGAQHAEGDILYFLHADSFPPKDFDALICKEVYQGHEAGCFRMQFDSTHWWLKLASWLTQFNWKVCRGGDQSLFVTKTLFNAIGGYDENYMIYEDQILIHALYAKKQFVVIDKKLKTSARMYRKHGIWKLQYYYWSIYVKRWLGADAHALYTYYKRHII